jgi:hypothetical protein
VFSAAPIFHIRRRLARNRFASPACCAWRFTASACELDAVEQSSCHYNDNFRISGGIRTPSLSWPVDAHRGNFGWAARNLADHDDSRRPMGHGFARNHWLRCRHVRTGSMVSRCSPVWVEARGTTAQNQPQLLKSSFINHKISGLKEAVSSLPRVCDLPRSGAVCKRNKLDNLLIGKLALHSSSIGDGLNAS